ncbi:MAG: response regulator transcription factor [Ruthenibacterium sp.]
MHKLPRILVVEDDESIRMLLEVSLRASGFAPLCFESATEALKSMETQSNVPDAAVLDIMLEGMDGITLLKLMRAHAKLAAIPIMMLTAKDAETDKIAGLDAGADDYMTKPFSVLELCARVRALLRRGGFEQTQKKTGALQSGTLRVDLAAHEATLNDTALELTYKEFELLQTLMTHAPGALTREELLQSVWGYDFVGETRTLDMHIGTLRAKLCDDSAAPRFIKTVRGVGYRFLGAVDTAANGK